MNHCTFQRAGVVRRRARACTAALASLLAAALLVGILAQPGFAMAGRLRSQALPHLLSDVPYGPLPEQVLDVHVPAGVPGPLPIVVFAHAGGWVGGIRGAIPDVIRILITDVHVAVVSIDYRLVREDAGRGFVNSFPTASFDLDRAIRFVRLNAVGWGLDPGRIIVAGASAGGHLAALAGAAPGIFADPDLPPELARVSPVVQGVIDYVGPSDFRTFGDAGGWAPDLMAAFLDCAPGSPASCDPARANAASVVPHLTAGAPPAYFAYGEQDALVVAATQGAPLAAAWAAARGEQAGPIDARGVRYEQAAGAEHNLDLGNSDFRTMEVWARAVVAGRLQ